MQRVVFQLLTQYFIKIMRQIYSVILLFSAFNFFGQTATISSTKKMISQPLVVQSLDSLGTNIIKESTAVPKEIGKFDVSQQHHLILVPCETNKEVGSAKIVTESDAVPLPATISNTSQSLNLTLTPQN
jgi:hypothetical protein